ncbi:Proline dehydrogenase 1, mitochondrial [Halotydeus destructor]|nr:Proline dehydrogenase 1, mitochondrial [Halotydeus destructor]
MVSGLIVLRRLNGQRILVLTNRGLISSSRTAVQFEQNRGKASTATFTNGQHVANLSDTVQQGRRKDPLDLTFTNTKDAYKSKTTKELLRGMLVLWLTSFDFIVDNNQKLIKLSRTILRPYLFRKLMKATFYGHFVAGEDEVDIRPKVDRLRTFGVKAILDYSAEEDLTEAQVVKSEMSLISEDDGDEISSDIPTPQTREGELKQFQPQKEFADRRKFKAKARTYFYLNEANCEKTMDVFLRCIDTVSGVTGQTGFAAIKLTALGRPQILLQLSEVIARTRILFREITGEEMNDNRISPEEFQEKYKNRFNITTDSQDVKQWFKNMDSDQRGLLNLFSWNGLVDMQVLVSDLFKVPNLKSGKMEPIIKALSREEDEMFRNMMRRIHTIAKAAQDRDVRVMIDAEQTYFQPAISRITLELMRKYNKEKAIVFNTYQCYLKSTHDSILVDLELARRQNFYFGAKLVRGAYMEQERERAKQVGYEDPINPTFDATTEMYHKTLTEAMRQIVVTGIDNKRISMMVASHNEDTVRYTVQKMQEFGIRPEHKVICFGQLYAMCDHVSFPLGQSGYSVYKYVPYGPVEEVIPYLSRRGAENNGVLAKVIKERRLLKTEVLRRLTSGEFFHKPVGDYTPI